MLYIRLDGKHKGLKIYLGSHSGCSSFQEMGKEKISVYLTLVTIHSNMLDKTACI